MVKSRGTKALLPSSGTRLRPRTHRTGMSRESRTERKENLTSHGVQQFGIYDLPQIAGAFANRFSFFGSESIAPSTHTVSMYGRRQSDLWIFQTRLMRIAVKFQLTRFNP